MNASAADGDGLQAAASKSATHQVGPLGKVHGEQVEVAVRGSDGPVGRPPPLEIGEDQPYGPTTGRWLADRAVKKAETALDGRPDVGALLGQAGQRTEPGEWQGLGGVRTVPVEEDREEYLPEAVASGLAPECCKEAPYQGCTWVGSSR